MGRSLTAVHRFDAPADAVAAVMADPDFHAALRLPDVEPPELLSHEQRDNVTTIKVRFEFSGSLDPIARRVLGRDRVAWVQTLVVDLSARTATLDVAPQISIGGQVDCRASFTLRDTGADTSERTLAGTLSVKIPLVGGRAESALAPGIMRRIDLEAAELALWL